MELTELKSKMSTFGARGYQELNFGHDKFGMSIRHARGDAKSAIRFVGLESKGQVWVGNILYIVTILVLICYLRVIKTCLV